MQNSIPVLRWQLSEVSTKEENKQRPQLVTCTCQRNCNTECRSQMEFHHFRATVSQVRTWKPHLIVFQRTEPSGASLWETANTWAGTLSSHRQSGKTFLVLIFPAISQALGQSRLQQAAIPDYCFPRWGFLLKMDTIFGIKYWFESNTFCLKAMQSEYVRTLRNPWRNG